jgi:hypothetical protein
MATTIAFGAPAPADAHLRFIAVGNALEVSCDGGATWQASHVRGAGAGQGGALPHLLDSHAGRYAGGTRPRRSFWGGAWEVRDASIWSRSATDVPPAPPGRLRIVSGS